MTARATNFGNLDPLPGMLAVYVALGYCRRLRWSGMPLVGALLAEWMASAGVPRRVVAIGAASFAAGAGLVLACGAWQSRDRVLVPLFERLGLRSYPIYIVHFPVLAVLSAFVFENAGRRPMHGWLALAGAFACVGAGVLCFEACERHFLHSRYRDSAAAP